MSLPPLPSINQTGHDRVPSTPRALQPRRPSRTPYRAERHDQGLEFARHEAHVRGAALQTVRADGEPAEALLRAAQDAQLLVVGCHHSDDRWSTRLGPVPTSILHRSPCPVVVVGAAHGSYAHAGVREDLADRLG